MIEDIKNALNDNGLLVLATDHPCKEIWKVYYLTSSGRAYLKIKLEGKKINYHASHIYEFDANILKDFKILKHKIFPMIQWPNNNYQYVVCKKI